MKKNDVYSLNLSVYSGAILHMMDWLWNGAARIFEYEIYHPPPPRSPPPPPRAAPPPRPLIPSARPHHKSISVVPPWGMGGG